MSFSSSPRCGSRNARIITVSRSVCPQLKICMKIQRKWLYNGRLCPRRKPLHLLVRRATGGIDHEHAMTRIVVLGILPQPKAPNGVTSVDVNAAGGTSVDSGAATLSTAGSEV